VGVSGKQDALDGAQREDRRDDAPGMARLEAKADEPADQRADSLPCDDRGPGARAAERVLGDVRPEHEERRVRDEEVEGDPEREQPDPGVFGERLPALVQLADEVRRLGRHGT
jgi:hypothetical protein